MPSLSLVTQAGAPNSSATATQIQEYDAVAQGTTAFSSILQVQALPKLYFWFDVTVGGPITIQPQFAIRGQTITANAPPFFEPDQQWLNLGS